MHWQSGEVFILDVDVISTIGTPDIHSYLPLKRSEGYQMLEHLGKMLIGACAPACAFGKVGARTVPS
jgi:hypothetical protein